MKVAYLTTEYPAVSHTFILREIHSLRARGVQIGTFSVRQPAAGSVLGPEASQEAAATRYLLASPSVAWCRSFLWLAVTRPLLGMRTLASTAQRGLTLKQRLLRLCYFLEAILLARWLVTERFDHLHCHFGNSGATTGMLAAELAGIPFSMTCHGSELLEPVRHRLFEKVAKASFVACVSKHGRAQLMMACPPETWQKIRVVRCGPARPCTFLASPCRHANNHILCVARLSKEKGHLVLLDALAILRSQGWEGTCTLIGDGPMRPAIERRIAELNLTDTVQMPGAVEADEVMRRYATADVVVLSSFSEGVPVVLMEAMACCRPVVATRVGGVPELVIDGVSGLLAAPGDAEELAERLRRVLTDQDLALRLAKTGATHVTREFDSDAGIGKLWQLFRGDLPGHQKQAVEDDLASQRTACAPQES